MRSIIEKRVQELAVASELRVGDGFGKVEISASLVENIKNYPLTENMVEMSLGYCMLWMLLFDHYTLAVNF
jgi:hypothetical protein